MSIDRDLNLDIGLDLDRSRPFDIDLVLLTLTLPSTFEHHHQYPTPHTTTPIRSIWGCLFRTHHDDPTHLQYFIYAVFNKTSG